MMRFSLKPISSKNCRHDSPCRQEFSRLTKAATNQTCFGAQCDTPRQRSGLELECMNIRSNLANNGKGPRISSEGAKDQHKTMKEDA
jgi:hypothetical protein